VNCRQATRLFDAYLDGELSGSLTAEMHAHLVDCWRCRQSMGMLQACGDVIATDSAEPEVPADLADRVLAGLPQRPEVRSTIRVPWGRWGRVAAGLAAAAAILLVVSLLRPSTAPPLVPERPTVVLDDAMVRVEVEDLQWFRGWLTGPEPQLVERSAAPLVDLIAPLTEAVNAPPEALADVELFGRI